ncbi:CHASE2 domain-containing protein [Microcoleus sp. CAWBG58]|uniref:CHASE2 domain-containing protein n=1 Tax=Microcoleus sp. CAWBG58 TaxID=2841651 RepID=UPI0025DFBFCB|nr:CHASE2 domain-containing protein [Microcoleus sp. CAWBG58]
MVSPLESSVVRIYSRSGLPIGAGFLVSDKYILTCAHVVADALGEGRETVEMPEGEVTLDFPILAPGQQFKARVIFWQPLNPQAKFEDIAGLELESKPPVTAQPAPLTIAKNLWGHQFKVMGFPEGQHNGAWAEGELRGRLANGWVQLEAVRQPGYRLEGGFSGAPVWDDRLQAVVGIAVAADIFRPEVKVAFIIPTASLVTAWSVPQYNLLPPSSDDRRFRFWKREVFSQLRTVLLASLVVTGMVLGVRQTGGLETYELKAFDLLMRSRPEEKPDPRLLVVTATEEDVAKYQFPLPDGILAQAIAKLKAYKPQTIALDIWRDVPREPGHAELVRELKQNENLIAVCSVGNPSDFNKPDIGTLVAVPEERLGFSDVVKDADNILRRQLLSMNIDKNAKCQADLSLSFQIALNYLHSAHKIEPTLTKDQQLKIGNTIFRRLQFYTGGYQQNEDNGQIFGGYQILLNYRAVTEVAEKVTLTELLNGEINPKQIKDKIVLIGVTAASAKDYHATPYSSGGTEFKEMPGVMVQAQMVSQILSAVLDGRSLIWVLPQWGEFLWIGSWSFIGGVLASRVHRRKILALSAVIAIAVLSLMCWVLLIWGGWMPLIPSVLVFVATGGSTIGFGLGKTSPNRLNRPN